jgi:hypothetical protein
MVEIDALLHFMNAEELAVRWHCGIHAIQALAETKQIQFFLRPVAIEVALESIIGDIPIGILSLLVGQPLDYRDVHRIFKHKEAQITIRKPIRLGASSPPLPEIHAEFCDLVVPLEVVESFEQAHASIPSTTQIFRLLMPDFSCFVLRGREYKFGEMQAKIIHRLYNAWESGKPWVYGKRLLSEVGSGSDRIQSVFNHNNNWRKVILSDSKGMYRLNMPPKDRQLSLF